MTAPEKLFPYVFFAGIRNGEARKGYGYFVIHPDGTWWCFQDQREGDPFGSGAFELDRQFLKEIPDDASERQVFLYQKLLNDTSEEN